MTVKCYAGLPGGGKTYSAVENFIVPALKEGRHVAHNLNLNVDALCVLCEREVGELLHPFERKCSPADLVRACEGCSVIVIDEVWNYWPAGMKANQIPQEELAFFKEHRHKAADGWAREVLIIDQDPMTGIPAVIRSLIQSTYVHEKKDAVGMDTRFQVDIYRGGQSSVKPAKRAHVRTMFGRYRPEIFNCYVSQTLSDELGEHALEKSPDRRATVWGSFTMQAAIGALVCLPLIGVAVMRGWHRVGANGATVQASAASAHSAPAAPSHGSATGTGVPSHDGRVFISTTSAGPPVSPRPSETWRYAGQIRVRNLVVAVLDGDSASREVPISACHRDEVGQWSCVVDGQLVTQWSGPKPAVLEQLAAKVSGFGQTQSGR